MSNAAAIDAAPGPLAGRVAVVTGAASGIGQAIVRTYIAAGAQVLAVDRSPLAPADADREGVIPFEQDLTAPEAAERIVAEAGRRWGRIDVLVNNAGIAKDASLEETSDELWDLTLLINLTVPFRLCRAALPLLKRSAAGRIVNVGSVMSSFGSAGLSAYVASKHGVAGLTKCLASELGPFGITANYIQPGAVLTGITRDGFAQNPAFRQFWENKAALGRVGQPEDIAPLALFLASPGAGFISGQGFIADGGAVQAP